MTRYQVQIGTNINKDDEIVETFMDGIRSNKDINSDVEDYLQQENYDTEAFELDIYWNNLFDQGENSNIAQKLNSLSHYKALQQLIRENKGILFIYVVLENNFNVLLIFAFT